VSDRDWLFKEDSAPPRELAAAMRSAVGEKDELTPNDLLDAAEHLLDKVLRTDCETRASALDLLTVDALATHALRLASDDPKLLEEFPERAMRRIASRSRR
jgi:hypothetical protein